MTWLSDDIRIMLMLVRRNLKVFRATFLGALLDSFVVAILDVILFGYLFPLMGMNPQLIAPLFIGNIIFMLFMTNFSFSFKMLFDLEFDRLIDYYSILPIKKRWLYASYILNYCIQAITLSTPPLIIGYILLQSRFGHIELNIPLFIVCYLLSILFLATLFIAFSFLFPFNWYRINVWPRIISPLLCLSTDLFPWHKLHAFWPVVANLFLLNPITYVVEGLRTNFVGGPQSLSNWICIPVLSVSVLGALWLLSIGIKRRLDPV